LVFHKWLTTGELNWIAGDILTAADLNGSIDETMPPIGAIIAWDKSQTGVPATLPDGWVECLTGETKITLEDGSTLPIREIVENKLPVKVLCYDEKTGKVVGRKVKNWMKTPSKKSDFCRIRTIVKDRIKLVNITPNHPVYSENGWVKPEETDHVFVKERKLSEIQKQYLLGTMFGDGSAEQYGGLRYSISHGISQREAITFAEELFGNFESNVWEYTSNNNFGSFRQVRLTLEICEPVTEVLKMCLDETGKKTINKKLLDKLDEAGLAFFYCDDGTLQSDNRSSWTAANFYTNDFTKQEVELFVEWLKNKFGIEAAIYHHKGSPDNIGWYVRCSADGSRRLFELISPYIIDCFQYKLPQKYRGRCNEEKLIVHNTEWGIHKRPLLDTKQPLELRGGNAYNTDWDSKYNLEVEEHNNYFANSILVHNCNGQVISDADSPMNGDTIRNLNGSGGGTQRFIRGSTTSGTTGGSADHNHGGNTGAGTNISGASGSGTAAPAYTHTHTISSSDHLPYYMEMVFIQRIK